MSLNLAVLQRLDAKINQIIATAGHVALYKFLPATQAWERKEVEGSLFVVERTEEPLHTIVVLNRISIENFCEPITPGLQMRVSEPYLLLRNYKNETTGVWFYSKEEQHKISQAVRALLDDKAAGTTAGPGTAGAAGTKKSKAAPAASADKERTATTKTAPAADKEKASSPAPPGGAGGGPPGLSAPSAPGAAAPPAVAKSSAPSSNGYAPLQTNVASLLSAVLSGSGGGGVSGGGPSYAQAVARDSIASPATTAAVAAPAPAPATTKPEQESPRDPHGSNAAGTALLNLLQPSADSRERDTVGQHQLPPHQQQQQQNGPLVHPHPHQLHPHPQPLFPPHLLHPQLKQQQQPQPPHFLHPGGGPGQPHMVPQGMHPGQHPHQPLMPHHPILRQPMQPGMHPGQPPLMPQPAPMMHHPQQQQQQQQQQSARSLASKQHLRSVLLSLANDDSFIDMVYESYMTQLAQGASQKSAPS